MGENRYLSYQGMVTTVTTSLAQIGDVCERITLDRQADELRQVSKRLSEHIFSVGIMGEFRRGKSTVINALLGQKIVPADIIPCSATLNYVRWDASEHAEILFKNGEVKEIPVEELSDYVTKLTKESEAMAETVESATVYYPCSFCQNGVQIVDTPGLNDDERMTGISEKVIPNLDAIIMVLVPDSPFSQSEAEFVRNKLMTSDLGKLIFVVNKIDIIDEDDVPRLISSIKEKIKTSVLEKMALIYDAESEEYKAMAAKVGEINVIPVSARNALKAKTKNNADLLAESGYPELEAVLSKLLTEERGAIGLLGPINKITSVSKHILETIETRREAMNIDKAEFERIQLESIDKIKDARRKKKEEIEGLKARGKNVYAELLPDVNVAYSALSEKLTSFVESYPITEDDLKNEESTQAFSQGLSQAIDKQVEEVLVIHTEKLSNKIRERLGEDVEALNAFNCELEQSLSEIRENIKKSAKRENILADYGKSALIEFGGIFAQSLLLGGALPGLGGIISGYRDYGVKGAVVGGAASIALGFGAAVLGVSLGLAGLPLTLIAVASSTFGGKAVTGLLFGKKSKSEKQIAKTRAMLGESVIEIVDKMKDAKAIEEWLKTTCETAYDRVAGDIDKEWEISLSDMEKTLTQIKVDIEMNASSKEKNEQEMQRLSEKVLEIVNEVKPIREKLAAVIM